MTGKNRNGKGSSSGGASYYQHSDGDNDDDFVTTSVTSSKKELQKAIDTVKGCLRRFILNCPYASERIVLSTWHRVTYKYQDEWNALEEGLKIYLHANPLAYRYEIKELYLEVEDEIKLNKGSRR